MKVKIESSCRICLSNKGVFPIFEDVAVNNRNIKSSLFLVLNEEIPDLCGFPRKICSKCNKSVEAMCNFINTYRRSCDILNERLNKADDTNSLPNNIIQDCLEVKIEVDCDDDNLWKQEYPNEEFDDIYPDDIKLKNLPKETADIYTDDLKLKNLTKETVKTIKTETSRPKAAIKKRKETCLTSKKVNKNQDKLKGIETKIPKATVGNKGEAAQKLCDICGTTFKTEDGLTNHLLFHSQTKVKCPQCPTVVYSSTSLRRHIKYKHGKDKFKCPSCDAVFSYQPALNTHIKRVHQKVAKTFTCQICNKDYLCKVSLLVHQRSVHTGERPEVCKVCNASFVHTSYLREHMRLHTGVTPFKCPICDRGYAQQSNMWSHVLHNHKLSDFTQEQKSKLPQKFLKKMKAKGS